MNSSVCVVGSGLSGMMTAINIKAALPAARVVILEKPLQQSNTQIAGMRLRQRRSGSTAASAPSKTTDIIELLRDQNMGIKTPEMERFATLATSEVERWTKTLTDSDKELANEFASWFGPQWGKSNDSGVGGRGLSILQWLRNTVTSMGIPVHKVDVTDLQIEGSRITGLLCQERQARYSLNPDWVVLANGNAGGMLYDSTNKVIKNSSTELLFRAGVALEGSTINMWHPFGHASADGIIKSGCYETDNLAGAKVRLADGTIDEETTALLEQHKAHYYFAEISRRFVEHGSHVTLEMPSGDILHAQVSLHYSHIAPATENDLRVKGYENVSVVGDAGGLLKWTNYRKRLPGFALTHCAVSAKIVSDSVIQKIEGGYIQTSPDNGTLKEWTAALPNIIANGETNKEQRSINTSMSLALEFTDKPSSQILAEWQKALNEADNILHKGASSDTVSEMSHGLVRAWRRRVSGEQEPVPIKRDDEHIKHHDETTRELRPIRRKL